jgi:sulfur carrier protein ThiS
VVRVAIKLVAIKKTFGYKPRRSFIMSKTLRVGIMPGKIQEVAVASGSTVADALEVAGLDAKGYDIKVDGAKVDASASVDNANLVLLVKQVKGNCGTTVRVGMMPGKITEHAVEVGTKVFDLLTEAGLDASGYDVKVDGTKVDSTTATITESTNLVLLVKQVKGNATVRIGMMPGKIQEFALEENTTYAQALDEAGLDAKGYDVKADGTKISDLDSSIGSTNLILLVKQVKGN